MGNPVERPRVLAERRGEAIRLVVLDDALAAGRAEQEEMGGLVDQALGHRHPALMAIGIEEDGAPQVKARGAAERALAAWRRADQHHLADQRPDLGCQLRRRVGEEVERLADPPDRGRHLAVVERRQRHAGRLVVDGEPGVDGGETWHGQARIVQGREAGAAGGEATGAAESGQHALRGRGILVEDRLDEAGMEGKEGGSDRRELNVGRRATNRIGADGRLAQGIGQGSQALAEPGPDLRIKLRGPRLVGKERIRAACDACHQLTPGVPAARPMLFGYGPSSPELAD